jgi:hypothetical protein
VQGTDADGYVDSIAQVPDWLSSISRAARP